MLGNLFHYVLSNYFKDLNIKIRKIVTPYGEINDDASPLLRQIRKRIKDFDEMRNVSKETENL